MNSLNAFFYIWTNYIDKDEKDIKEVYKDVIDQIGSMEETNLATYFPVFTIGYFLFENNIEVSRIKEIYKKIVLVGGKQHSFERMMQSQILYLTKDFNKGVFGYSETLDRYIKWMES